MINDSTITFICNFNLDETIEEFKKEFNNIVLSKKYDCVHTFIISTFSQMKIHTEVIFCSFYNNTVIFYASPISVDINVTYDSEESNLLIKDGIVIPNGCNFIDILAARNNSQGFFIGRFSDKVNLLDEAKKFSDSDFTSLTSLQLNNDTKNAIIQQVDVGISLVGTFKKNNVFFDVYSVSRGSSVKLTQNDSDEIYENEDFVNLVVVTEQPDLLYVGNSCNKYGYVYERYTLNSEPEFSVLKNMIDANCIDESNICVDTTELADCGVDFFNEQMNRYKDDLLKTIESGNVDYNNDNPFMNMYYNDLIKIRENGPMEEPRLLGKNR